MFSPPFHRSFLPWFCVVATVAIWIVAPCRNAVAQDDWKASVYKGWSVVSIRLTGVDKDMAADIKKGLALARSTGFLGSKRPTFYPQTLNEDVNRCLLFLARNGYPHATVTPRFTPQPKRRDLEIVFDIDPGDPVIVTSVPIVGVPDALKGLAARRLDHIVGAVFSDKRVDAATVALDSLLTFSGYARAAVESRVSWQDSSHVVVHFQVEAGAMYYFGDVTVTGASGDLLPLIDKTTTFERGERYSPEVLAESQKNLRVLGLFRQVRFDLVDEAPDTLGVAISVLMREPRTFEANARYWTDEGFSAGARWTHRNIFRRGRGMQVVLFGSVLRQVAEVSAWWPAIFWARSRGVATVGTLREDEESYSSISTGIDLILKHEYSPVATVWGGVSLSNEQIENKTLDPSIEDGEGRLFAFKLGFDRQATNQPIVATSGTITRGSIEWAPAGQLSQNHYVLGQITGIVYLPLFAKSGLAARMTLGAGEPIGTSTNILQTKLFYSGGANSMRGFERRKLGPLSADGAPLGGESMFEASLEYRFPILWRFRGTAFVDTGQVWPERVNLGQRKISVAVGPGLWIETPVGPIRGDYGYRVTNYESTQPRAVFHFSIGAAF